MGIGEIAAQLQRRGRLGRQEHGEASREDVGQEARFGVELGLGLDSAAQHAVDDQMQIAPRLLPIRHGAHGNLRARPRLGIEGRRVGLGDGEAARPEVDDDEGLARGRRAARELRGLPDAEHGGLHDLVLRRPRDGLLPLHRSGGEQGNLAESVDEIVEPEVETRGERAGVHLIDEPPLGRRARMGQLEQLQAQGAGHIGRFARADHGASLGDEVQMVGEARDAVGDGNLLIPDHGGGEHVTPARVDDEEAPAFRGARGAERIEPPERTHLDDGGAVPPLYAGRDELAGLQVRERGRRLVRGRRALRARAPGGEREAPGRLGIGRRRRLRGRELRHRAARPGGVEHDRRRRAAARRG